jgi:hypothetical protein
MYPHLRILDCSNEERFFCLFAGVAVESVLVWKVLLSVDGSIF